jgi:hypothetical protein
LKWRVAAATNTQRSSLIDVGNVDDLGYAPLIDYYAYINHVADVTPARRTLPSSGPRRYVCGASNA